MKTEMIYQFRINVYVNLLNKLSVFSEWFPLIVSYHVQLFIYDLVAMLISCKNSLFKLHCIY